MEYSGNMAVLLPVAGGKGGVGKSIVSLNLAVTLAHQCKNTILCDMDLGGANLHTLLGLKNNQAGLGTYITKIETDFLNLLQATGIPSLQFIAGDCHYPGVANMDFFTKQKIIKNIQSLDADYVIMDLGAGSTYNIIDFFLTSYDGLIVVSPDLTSILNAYSFLKSAVFRFCYRQFKPKSPERQILQNSILQRMEGKEYSFEQILSVIASKFPESAEKAFTEMKKLHPRIIMNMGRGSADVELGNRLLNLTHNKLSITAEYIGFVPYDDNVSLSIARRQPLSIMKPDSPLCLAMPDIAARIESTASNQDVFLEDMQENLEEIVKNYYEKLDKKRQDET